MMDNLKTGQFAEHHACEFLQRQGLQLLRRNYRCHQGEIDLIMQDRQDIVFVEVRVRNNHFCGDALDSVNYSKQQKLIKTATHFLHCNKLWDNVNCRFDVIGISYAQTEATVEWITDAFSVDDW
jgi:putative endonuclease